MGQIMLLSQETIDQIAAGEVVERPSSVVKELVENAIDAGATAVTVETKDGGLSMIRITDNGSGIAKEDIPIAFLRHSTSKIRSALDLFQVASLGFRGEALSSIAAVCQVELITRTKDALCAVRYLIEGGTEISVSEIGAPAGTTFFVRNIFYNTPVRRNFLKSSTTEGAYIADLMNSIALSHPEISFQLIQNGKNRLYTSGNGKLLETCYSIFGRQEVASFLEISAQDEDISLQGYIADSTNTRGNRNYEYYFINGRYIRSPLIAKAIEDGYKGFLMQHRYPFVVLLLSIPQQYIDVNVHPTKMEIRFRDEERLYRMITKAIAMRLRNIEMIPSVEDTARTESSQEKTGLPIAPEPFLKERKPLETAAASSNVSSEIKAGEEPKTTETLKAVKAPDSEGIPKITETTEIPEASKESTEISGSTKETLDTTVVREAAASYSGEKEPLVNSGRCTQIPQTLYASVPKTVQEEQQTLFQEKLLSEAARSKHRLIGQLFDTYWLLQYEDKLFIMDQHAAHEKVLYEKNVRAFQEKQGESQLISPPIVLDLRSHERIVLKEYMELFHSLGYELEEFGIDTYAVRAVPSNLYHLDQKELLLDLLDDLCGNGAGSSNATGNADSHFGEGKASISLPVLTDKLATMACKAAVKGNMHLSFQEADALIEQLLQLENPYACPHGRPTLISMTKYEIERRFSRKL